MTNEVSMSRNCSLAAAALLVLMPIATSRADAPAPGTVSDTTATPEPASSHPPASAPPYASEVPRDDFVDDKDGTTLAADSSEDTIPVAEELDFIVGNDFRKRGGYDENLKSVGSVDYYGTRYVGCEQYPLEIHAARPDRIARLVKTGGSSKFESRKSSKGVVIRGEPVGLSIEDERALLETFDFDTPIIELERKSPVVKPLGMQKLPGKLIWKLGVDRSGGYRQVMYVDSHNGDVVKSTIFNTQGAPVLDVAPHDYRSVEGIRIPFATDYRRPDGTELASDRLKRVEVKRTRS
jgi:hypothetical protein